LFPLRQVGTPYNYNSLVASHAKHDDTQPSDGPDPVRSAYEAVRKRDSTDREEKTFIVIVMIVIVIIIIIMDHHHEPSQPSQPPTCNSPSPSPSPN
jgi:hypothetical protein